MQNLIVKHEQESVISVLVESKEAATSLQERYEQFGYTVETEEVPN